MAARLLVPLPARRLPPPVARRAVADPNATLVGRREVTDGILVLRVRPDVAVPFVAGQYHSLGMRIGDRLIQRPYSPASRDADGEVELLIRRVAGGELTPRLWRLRLGARLHLGRAKGLFRLEPADARRHLFMATGTGVAPMIAMIGELLSRTAIPEIALVHGVTLRSELAFTDRLAAWRRNGAPIRYLPALSRPDHPENAGWTGRTGHLTELLAAIAQEASLGSDATVAYLCGNPAVVAGLAAGLRAFGLPEVAIRREEYWPQAA